MKPSWYTLKETEEGYNLDLLQYDFLWFALGAEQTKLTPGTEVKVYVGGLFRNSVKVG